METLFQVNYRVNLNYGHLQSITYADYQVFSDTRLARQRLEALRKSNERLDTEYRWCDNYHLNTLVFVK